MDTIKPVHENAAKAISPVCMLETNSGTFAFVTGCPPIKREKTSVIVVMLTTIPNVRTVPIIPEAMPYCRWKCPARGLESRAFDFYCNINR